MGMNKKLFKALARVVAAHGVLVVLAVWFIPTVHLIITGSYAFWYDWEKGRLVALHTYTANAAIVSVALYTTET